MRVGGPNCSAAHLFSVLWEALSDVMGSAATATLLRRAAKHATSRKVDLEGLVIARGQFTYEYAVPASWMLESDGARQSLQQLLLALTPLLIELTGPVVHRRLSGIPELKNCGLFAEVNQ